jgi:hypothetical protein
MLAQHVQDQRIAGAEPEIARLQIGQYPVVAGVVASTLQGQFRCITVETVNPLWGEVAVVAVLVQVHVRATASDAPVRSDHSA